MPVIVADELQRADGPAHAFLSHVNSPVPIVLVSRVQDFKFNPELEKLDKYVLVDFFELGWDWDQQIGSQWGRNAGRFMDIFLGDEWKRLDEFIANKPPLVTFQRELLEQYRSDTIVPIEYPNWQPEHPAQTKEQFDKRPIELFHYWGFSHPARKRFQGEAHLHSLEKDIDIIDNIFYLENFLQENHKRYWATIHIPHFARLPISQILEINGRSKLSLSLPGAGKKCFRSTGESPVNSVMVCQLDRLAWSYMWINGVNCIQCFPENEIEAIELALQRDDLYQIYLYGLETASKYRIENYIKNYIEPTIKKHA